MKRGAAYWFFGIVFMIGCSDATAPSSAMFRARLSGARVASLSGPSNAGVAYSETGIAFSIRMFAPQGDTLRAISIACPGQEPPAPGTYAVGESASDCVGGYGRLVSTAEAGSTTLEHATATFGSVTISPSSGDQIVGTFTFNGILVLGSDSVGTVTASGAFSAEVIP